MFLCLFLDLAISGTKVRFFFESTWCGYIFAVCAARHNTYCCQCPHLCGDQLTHPAISVRCRTVKLLGPLHN